jgi:predicted dehydrogenase
MKAGIIGLGHWGPNYVRILNQMPGIELKLCCDTDPARLSEIERQFIGVAVTDRPDEVFDDAQIDAVIVATPASTHYEVALRCIEAGKDVLVEKPLALTIEDSSSLVMAAEEKDRVLMVGHTFLYNPGVKKVKDLVDAGEVGNLYYLQSTRTHLGLIREDVGVIWDLAPHDIAIFAYLTGHWPEGVTAVGGSFLRAGREDVAFVTLHFPNGTMGSIHVSWIDSNKVRRVTVVGSKGRAVFDDLDNLERVKFFEKGISVEKSVSDYGEFQLLLRDGDIISPKIEASEPLRNMCLEFINSVASRRQPLSDGICGLEVVRVIKAAEKSLAEKGGYIPIER